MTKEIVRFIDQGYQAWPIINPSTHPTARLAANELHDYLGRISDRDVPIYISAAKTKSPCITLRLKDGTGDGFIRHVSPGGIEIIGRSPRGLLYGVYDLLEDLGCRWYYPGERGERIPRAFIVGLPAGIKDEEPALRGRGLILGHEAYLDDATDWIAWAARNRYNTLFFHPYPPKRRGGRYRRRWRRLRKAIRKAMEERSMRLEYGGHLLDELLPRRLFWRNRRAFRFDGEQRTRDANLCVSNPEAHKIIQERARRFFEVNEGIDVFHLWPDDVRGVWCQCPDCRRLSSAEQALTLTNLVAEILADVDPAARVSYLAYQDTLDTPLAVRPEANVELCFAPRERCYAHALDDGHCAVNRPFWQALQAQVDWFSTGEASGMASAFEYYMDGVLFKGLAPILSNTLAADVIAYRDAGCHGINLTTTNVRPWLSLPLNGFLFGRLAWQPHQGQTALLRDVAEGYYGGPGGALATYLAEKEVAAQLLLDLVPEESIQNAEEAATNPAPLPRDVLDFMDAPLAVSRPKLTALEEAREHLEAAAENLEVAMRPGRGHKPRGRVTRQEILEQEAVILELEGRIYDFIYYRQLGYCLAKEGARRRETVKAARQARQALGEIQDWGQENIPKAWQASFQRLCRLWSLHLTALRQRALARTPMGRAWLRWRLRFQRKRYT
jgi:hypothetical protein